MIYPHDLLPERLPKKIKKGQQLIDEKQFVPAQNKYGGFIYAGGTMAFTAAYWILHYYKPKQIAFMGCDMVTLKVAQLIFMAPRDPDPLRDDISLTSLEACAARFYVFALQQGCETVNLSNLSSRLIFPRANETRSRLPSELLILNEKAIKQL